MSKEMTTKPIIDLSVLSDFKAEGANKAIGLEATDRSDFKLPKIKLIQNTSVECTKGKVPAGSFYNSITKEHTTALACVLLALGKSRVMWKKPFKRGEDPLCRSFDGITKWDGTRKCDSCKYQDWNKLPEGENRPPCNMSYVWLGVTAGTETPFRFIASGSSVSPTKDFINTIVPTRLSPFAFKVTLRSEQQSNESGVFYVAKYEVAGTSTKEEYLRYRDLSEGMAAMFLEANKIDPTDAQEEPTEKTGEFF